MKPFFSSFLPILFLTTSFLSAGESEPTSSASPQAEEPPAQILILLEQGFNGDEFFSPTAAFKAAGYELVIASTHESYVPLRLDGEPNPRWDVPVDLSISDVNPANFRALFVPGGYSPGFLEHNEEAVAIVKHFIYVEDQDPLGMVCHGPRVLLTNGLLEGRTWTGLFNMADEVADAWVERPGRYLDQPVVVDGNLVTSRYPLDMGPFAREFLMLLDRRGIGEFLPKEGQVALVLSNHPEGWGNWHFFSRLLSAINGLGLEGQRAGAHAEDWVSRVVGEWEEGEGVKILALDIFADDWEEMTDEFKELAITHPFVVAGESMRELLTERELPTVWVGERNITQWAKAIFGVAKEHGDINIDPLSEIPELPSIPEIPTTNSVDEAKAILALREGFTDEALVAWLEALLEAGVYPVAMVSHHKGLVIGLNGLEVEAGLAYDDLEPRENQLIIAPGFFWPQKNERARQAVQPDWIDEQETRDQAREDWLLKAHEAGAKVVLTGLDALRVGRNAEFDGVNFATTAQARWSFGRGAASFVEDAVVESKERLFTVRSGDDAKAALALIADQ